MVADVSQSTMSHIRAGEQTLLLLEPTGLKSAHFNSVRSVDLDKVSQAIIQQQPKTWGLGTLISKHSPSRPLNENPFRFMYVGDISFVQNSKFLWKVTSLQVCTDSVFCKLITDHFRIGYFLFSDPATVWKLQTDICIIETHRVKLQYEQVIMVFNYSGHCCSVCIPGLQPTIIFNID